MKVLDPERLNASKGVGIRAPRPNSMLMKSGSLFHNGKFTKQFFHIKVPVVVFSPQGLKKRRFVVCVFLLNHSSH